MKYIIWTISTIGDIFSYNEHELLVGNALDRIEKELFLIEEKEINYSKNDFNIFHSDMIEMGIAILPTTEKAIRKFEE